MLKTCLFHMKQVSWSISSDIKIFRSRIAECLQRLFEFCLGDLEPRSDHLLRIMPKLFGIILAIIVLGACTDRAEIKNEKLYSVDVDGEVFRIPGGYILHADSISGEQLKGVNLHALYPGVEPKTIDNETIFSEQGWSRGRKILFSLKGVSEHVREDRDLLLNQHSPDDSSKGIFDLSVYPSEIESREYLVGSMNDGTKIKLSCYKEGSVRFPSCRTLVKVSGNVEVYLTFSRDLLPEWKSLLSDVMKKIDSFKV